MSNATTDRRVRKHRDALSTQGLRTVQIRIPDSRAPGFAEECARQTALAAAVDRADPELMSFLDSALEDLGEALEDLEDRD